MKVAKIYNCALAEFEDSITSVVFLCGCDLNCDFCQNEELINCFKYEQDMEAQEVINAIKWDNIDWISFTGGEPLVHLDFTGIVGVAKYAKERGKLVNIDSNGYFIHSSPKHGNLKKIAPYLDCISIDVKTRMLHNQDYGNMRLWLEGADVAHIARYRMVALNHIGNVYFERHTINFLKRNGIEIIKLMKNSRLGRGVHFEITSSALMEEIATFYSDNGIEIMP